MKKEAWFVMAAALFGVIAALGTAVVLAAIAVPSMTQYLLTQAELSDWKRMAAVAQLFTGGMTVIAGVVLIAGMFLFAMLLRTINPSLVLSLKGRRTRAGVKLAIAVLASLCCLYLIAQGIDAPFQAVSGGGLAQPLMVLIGTAALWLIAGERGWAGDLSSWGMPRDGTWQRTALLGAGAGAAFFVISGMFNWSFGRYFILVSEVLDQSGETSFLGFQQLTIGLVVMLGTAFSLAAAFVVALAPVRREPDDLPGRLKAPAAALLVLLVLLAAGSWYAGNRYDLDKKSLAGVLGVPEKEQASRTIIVLLPSKDLPVTVQEWPLKVSGSSFTGQQTIALSAENLNKLEAYLDSHRDGTIYQHLGRDILAKGYHALGDGESGLKALQRAAESQIIHRMLLLARLRVLPVTDRNLKLLQAYSDEKTWDAGGRSALSLAGAFRHFGKTAEAERWLKKAKESGADVSKAEYLNDPVVVNGSVRGRIVLNGKPLAGVRAALLAVSGDPKALEGYSISDLTLSRALVDVRTTGPDGRFSFSSLGGGRYVLAVMLDTDKASFTGAKGTIAARNVSGVIRVGPVATRDVGTIEVTTER